MTMPSGLPDQPVGHVNGRGHIDDVRLHTVFAWLENCVKKIVHISLTSLGKPFHVGLKHRHSFYYCNLFPPVVRSVCSLLGELLRTVGACPVKLFTAVINLAPL